MDFGDILSQWDDIKNKQKAAGEKQASFKKADPQKRKAKDNTQRQIKRKSHNSSTKTHPVEIWLKYHGTIDKDAEAAKCYEREKMENRSYIKSLRPEYVIDLHGCTREEAWRKLDVFVTDCKAKGARKILIIHGKGNHSAGSDPVLGPMVRAFIENDRRLGLSGNPDRKMGGTGATWVIIKV